MRRARGLTLIEVLIVILVLALLAAVVKPQLSRAGSDTRSVLLRESLMEVRSQIRLYQTQHENRLPTLAQFLEEMTGACEAPAAAGSAAQARKPTVYLPAIPVNPYTGANRISNTAVGTSDWYYDETTGLFRANHDAAFITY